MWTLAEFEDGCGNPNPKPMEGDKGRGLGCKEKAIYSTIDPQILSIKGNVFAKFQKNPSWRS